MTAKRRQVSYALANHFGGDQQTGELRFTGPQSRRLKHKAAHARRARKQAVPEPQQQPQTAQKPAAPDPVQPAPMTAQAIQAAAAAPRRASVRGLPSSPFRLRRKQAR